MQQSLKIHCTNAYLFAGELYEALKYSVKAHEFCNQAIKYDVKRATENYHLQTVQSGSQSVSQSVSQLFDLQALYNVKMHTFSLVSYTKA